MPLKLGKVSIRALRKKHEKSIATFEQSPGELNGTLGNIAAILIELGHISIVQEKEPKPKPPVDPDKDYEG